MHGNSYIGRGAVKARREGEEHVEHHNKAISDHTTGTLCTHTHNNNRPREREKGAACLYLWGICSHKTYTQHSKAHTWNIDTHTHTHTRICMDTHTKKYWYTLTFCMLYAINKLWYTFNFTHRYFHYKHTSTCTQNATFAYTNTHSFPYTKINMNNYLAPPYWMLHVTSESHF